jgi:hypothetical protein
MAHSDAKTQDEEVLALQATAVRVGRQLRLAIAELLDRLEAGGIRGQRSIAGALNLSQSVTSRLTRAVRAEDPLATLACAPAPEGLRKMLQGAARVNVDPSCLRRLEAAIGELEAFLDREVGNRDTLDALLYEWVHDLRASFELRHKAAAFRAMSALRGISARAVVVSAVAYPSSDPNRHDAIGFDAVIGCRRLRPSAVLRTLHSHLAPQSVRFTVHGLDGQPVRGLRDIFVPEFSTVAWEAIEARSYETFIEATVRDLPLGRNRSVDLVTAQVFRGVFRAVRGDGPPSCGIGGQAEPPAEYFIVDALVHDDIWPDRKPELRMFDTVVRGITHPDNPLRQGDRLDMQETVVFLGRGLSAFRIAEFPRYTELIQHACDKLGWDTRRLRGFRCKIRYPLYGCQIGLAFPLPE